MDDFHEELAFRVPTSPYPGLRPFLDHESMLLLGRGTQIKEVVARLRETRFVAVIGGSGCGKSSLIRAGVVPDLRGFGIPDEGDYWVPVVCTPGTIKTGTQATARWDPARDPSDRRPDATQSPITRLAWKFTQQLDSVQRIAARLAEREPQDPAPPPSDPETEAEARRQDVANMFRRGAGFARLVNAYSDELPVSDAMRKRSRFLFVIDQFEELFHPNNRGNDDATTMVEAVIEHFFNPHPRCFVVLTMRSEHLADCASHLQLPDAINKSSYLVRRLDEEELREAIVGPAKYFLRLHQRGSADTSLPDDVEFDEDVIDRLLADVGTIADDPDHLPLLQHLLARTWESASRRAQNASSGNPIPRRIDWFDLEHAVAPESTEPRGWLRDASAVHSLRHSLESWAEQTYVKHDKSDQFRIDTVLRNLGFKDPNNGQYSQQRLEVDDSQLFEGIPDPRAKLQALLSDGFVDSVNYLFWDKENPKKVTLKVSHESFIRGWEHFRLLVDAEAERFEEFVNILRRAAQWKVGESPDMLLEPPELARLDDAALAPVFAEPKTRDGWFQVLRQYRDGARLAQVEGYVDRFVAASRAQVAEDERMQLQQRADMEAAEARNLEQKAENSAMQAEFALMAARSRASRSMVIALVLIFVLVLPMLAFFAFVQRPVVQAVATFYRAGEIASKIRFNGAVLEGSAQLALTELVQASELVTQASQRGGFVVSSRWLDGLAALPLIRSPFVEMRKLFVQSSTETSVNGSLRLLLTTRVWRSAAPLPTTLARAVAARVQDDYNCNVVGPDNKVQRMKGRLIRAVTGDRALFFPEPKVGDADLTSYAVWMDGETCRQGARITWSVPRRIAPLVLVDAYLDYVAVTQTNAEETQPAVVFNKMVWDRGGEGLLQLSVDVDPDAVAVVRHEFEASETSRAPAGDFVRSVRTWSEIGGHGAAVGGKAWRVFTEGAQPIAKTPSESWTTMVAAAAHSRCAELGRLAPLPGFAANALLQGGTHCFSIQQRTSPVFARQPANAALMLNEAPAPTPAGNPPQSKNEVVVLVYGEPTSEQDARSSPLASLSFFDGSVPAGEWVVSRSPGHVGWIGHRTTGSDPVLRASPWSTEALRILAESVKSPPGTPPDARPPARAPGR